MKYPLNILHFAFDSNSSHAWHTFINVEGNFYREVECLNVFQLYEPSREKRFFGVSRSRSASFQKKTVKQQFLNFGLGNVGDSLTSAALNKGADPPEWLQS